MSTPTLSRSAKLYQERQIPEDRTTRRLPSARSDFDRNQSHAYPLSPPLPTPEALRSMDHDPPDAGLTKPWPQGNKEVV